MTKPETRRFEDASSGHFQARPLDDLPELLEKSFRLRYHVYCLERRFLRADDYPEGLETDEFDRHSIHIGAVDARGELAGTVRIVRASELGLPLFRHCTTFPHQPAFDPANPRIVEIGRVAVSRSYRRRADDDSYGVTAPSQVGGSARNQRAEKRRGREDVFLTMIKGVYQATKRIGVTHWLVGMEKPLHHLSALHGLPFRLIGPESDYLGLVAPYQLDLEEFDSVIASGRLPSLDQLWAGLEAEFRPPRAPLYRPPVEPPVFGPDTDVRLLNEFRRAAGCVPAYGTLLEEHGVPIGDVRDLASFSRLCPLLSKGNTFKRFPLEKLSVGGALVALADVLTSSGHGGQFSFGVMSRDQALASARFTDHAFDAAFSITTRKTLTINCLPMGVIVSSHIMTVATTSVREDMAVALIETFGHHYDQIVLVADPLFMKRLTDHAAARRLDWSRYRVHAIIGEEVFGENFRGYVAGCLGLTADQPGRGYILSSFGVGELGLHLCYETAATIGLRRALFNNPSFARDLLGAGKEEGVPFPMIFSFDPLRTFIEVVEPDSDGYGRMTTSMLDPDRTVPLLRYQTGDLVRLLDHAQVTEVARRHRVTVAADLPRTLLALKGRENDALPNGSHVAFYKDLLYADQVIARDLTGAFRVAFDGARCTMHVQLTPSPDAAHAVLEQGILRAIPSHLRPETLVLWPYAQFPFGMSLDYQRKFSHFAAPGEPDPGANSVCSSTREYAL
jgi:phenylacetate-CoA ligase